jgi:hypothetical protein
MRTFAVRTTENQGLYRTRRVHLELSPLHRQLRIIDFSPDGAKMESVGFADISLVEVNTDDEPRCAPAST